MPEGFLARRADRLAGAKREEEVGPPPVGMTSQRKTKTKEREKRIPGSARDDKQEDAGFPAYIQ